MEPQIKIIAPNLLCCETSVEYCDEAHATSESTSQLGQVSAVNSGFVDAVMANGKVAGLGMVRDTALPMTILVDHSEVPDSYTSSVKMNALYNPAARVI